MSRGHVKPEELTLAQVEGEIGPLEHFSHQCHAASLALVRSGLLSNDARVARGFLKGISSQHSWVVLGDPYDPSSVIIDVTAWSYDLQRNGGTVPRVWVTSGAEGGHTPHGRDSILDSVIPACGTGPDIPLGVEVSPEAENFLVMVASMNRRSGLDAQGWVALLSGSLDGWPAAEIVAAAHETPRLRAFIPIDTLGMLTDKNPQSLYQ